MTSGGPRSDLLVEAAERARSPTADGAAHFYTASPVRVDHLRSMFVVFALVAAFRAQGSDMRAGAWWYLPLLAGCWALGRGLAQVWSTPWDHALGRRLLSSPRAS